MQTVLGLNITKEYLYELFIDETTNCALCMQTFVHFRQFLEVFLANRNITGDVSNVRLLDLVTFTEKMVHCGHRGWTSTRRWAMVLVLRGSKYVKKSKKNDGD